MRCYFAHPTKERSPGVLVCMHGPGVDGFVTGMCDRLAEAGVAAIAPDLYHRQTEPAQSPMQAALRMTDREALADMAAALDALAREPGVDESRLGVLGFCMGGRLAFLQAANDTGRLHTCVVFYSGRMKVAMGGGPSPFEQLGNIQIPVLGIFGNDDENPSPQDVTDIATALERAGVPHEFHRYDGAGHAFLRNDDPARYREASAVDAWAKCVDWLTRRLG